MSYLRHFCCALFTFESNFKHTTFTPKAPFCFENTTLQAWLNLQLCCYHNMVVKVYT